MRAIFHRQRNLNFLMEEVTGVDLQAKQVQTASQVIAYDYLILSIGSRTNFFGMQSIETHGHELKDISSAIAACDAKRSAAQRGDRRGRRPPPRERRCHANRR